MRNDSGLHPLGHAVLVLHDEAKKPEGLIALMDSTTDRETMIETKVTVVAVGAECWLREGRARAVPGDRVMISRLTGYMVKGVDGRRYRFINDEDVFAKIVQEAS